MRIKTLQQLIEEGYSVTRTEDKGWFLLDGDYRGQFEWLGKDMDLHKDEAGAWRDEVSDDAWYIHKALIAPQLGDLVKVRDSDDGSEYKGILAAVESEDINEEPYCVYFWSSGHLQYSWVPTVEVIQND